jgi:hypothetical protein
MNCAKYLLSKIKNKIKNTMRERERRKKREEKIKWKQKSHALFYISTVPTPQQDVQVV